MLPSSKKEPEALDELKVSMLDIDVRAAKFMEEFTGPLVNVIKEGR